MEEETDALRDNEPSRDRGSRWLERIPFISFSSITFTPNSFALSSFDPASAPATT
jgi:hypothetical protein